MSKIWMLAVTFGALIFKELAAAAGAPIHTITDLIGKEVTVR